MSLAATLDRDAAAPLLSIATRIAAGTIRGIPALRLRVADGMLTVSAMGRDTVLVGSLPVREARDGEVTVQAEIIATIVEGAPAPDVRVVVEAQGDGQILALSAGAEQFSLPVIEEAVVVPVFEEETLAAATLDAPVLRTILSTVAGAVDRDGGSGVALTGIHLAIREGSLTATATDGKVLSRRWCRVEAATPGEAILAPTLVARIRDLVGEATGPVALTIAAKGATLRATLTGGATVSVRGQVLSANYPAVDAVCASHATAPIQIRVSTEALRSSLRRITAFAGKDGIVGLTILYGITPSFALVAMNTQKHGGGGDAAVACPFIDSPLEADCVHAIKASYLAEILNHVEGEEATFRFQRGLILVDGDAQHLIMPVTMPPEMLATYIGRARVSARNAPAPAPVPAPAPTPSVPRSADATPASDAARVPARRPAPSRRAAA